VTFGDNTTSLLVSRAFAATLRKLLLVNSTQQLLAKIVWLLLFLQEKTLCHPFLDSSWHRHSLVTHQLSVDLTRSTDVWLEYDNDNLPPEAPRRSAQESAIFAHLRRAGGPARPTTTVYSTAGPQRSTDYLNVKLPEGAIAEPEHTELGTGLRGSVGARRSIDIHSVLDTRKSVDVLRSDWVDKRASKVETSDLGYLGTPDEDEDPPEGGMDLSSWGLDRVSSFHSALWYSDT
jgi:hypothetical protein